MKKLLIAIFMAFSSPLTAEFCHPGEHIADFSEKQLTELAQLPDLKERLGAFGAGYGLSFGSWAAGNKCIPAMGIVRIGRFTIPVKVLINLLISYGVGYAPLMTYIYLHNPEEKDKKTF